jgi:hypothetical protein
MGMGMLLSDQPNGVVPANDAALKAAAELQTASWGEVTARGDRIIRSIAAKLFTRMAITAIGMFGAEHARNLEAQCLQI